MRTRLTFFLLLFTVPAVAHHSRSHYAQAVQELEGELVAVHWVNPHVGFTVDIRNAGGQVERWRVEGVGNLGGMRKAGIGSDVFTIGERVRFLGSLSVRQPRDFLATNVVLANGLEIVLDANAGPYFSERSIQRPEPAVAELKPVDTAAENRGIFRVWSGVPNFVGQIERFPFTEAAVAARARWDPVDNFATRCEAEGMPRIMRNPHPFEFIDRGTTIVIRSELYDLARVVHMNQTEPPAGTPVAPLGYSVGRWDDNTLIVTTTHVNWPYFDNIGTPQSEAVRMAERFTLSADQSRLDYYLTITDSGTFREPATYERYWLALGEDIEVYDCQVY